MQVIGTVRRPHGLSGEVSVQLVPGFPGELEPGSPVIWAAGGQVRVLTVSNARPHQGRVLLRFEEIGDVEAARSLSGGDLCVTEAPAPPSDFYYSHEIAGWRCEDAGGDPLGVATGVEETPAGALLSFQTQAGKEVLVPFVRPIVVAMDRGSKRIVLALPEGLMDL